MPRKREDNRIVFSFPGAAMGILDDAIKEHLELKRQHGAGEDELKKLEDEAFGASDRPGEGDSAPDPFAEAPTEFMAQPDLAEPPAAEEPAPAHRSRTDIADLQEAPPAAASAEQGPEVEETPAEEETPAIEQAIPEPEPEIPAGPSTEEREAIAEQPTEMFDIEEELGGSQAPAPTEDELVEEEMQEPRLAPVDPLAGVADTEEEEEDDAESDADDFFDEKRLSDELDQALEGPAEAEEEFEPAEEEEGEFEEEEEEEEDEEPLPEGQEEDVLEETPDFLEEAPEDDQLWFEQKPPKDFDFDD